MTEAVLLSGGLDSAVCLWRAAAPVAVFVDYGHPSADKEREAARALSVARGCFLYECTITLQIGTMADPTGKPGPRVIGGRNLATISLAVNVAVQTGATVVWLGAHAGDADDYPDCRAGFIAPLDRLCRATYGVGVAAPLIMTSRSNLAAEARMRVPVHLCWSCYTPRDGEPCGSCNSCRQER